MVAKFGAESTAGPAVFPCRCFHLLLLCLPNSKKKVTFLFQLLFVFHVHSLLENTFTSRDNCLGYLGWWSIIKISEICHGIMTLIPDPSDTNDY